MSEIENDPAFSSRINTLIRLSRERHTYAFSDIEWPDHIPDDEWWLPPELLTVYGTAYADELSESQLKRLSRCFLRARNNRVRVEWHLLKRQVPDSDLKKRAGPEC